MTSEEREDVLDRLRDYLRASRELTARTAEGREEIDEGSLALVLGLPKLYEDKEHWVRELEPIKRPKGRRGRREKSDSFDRFVKWLREKQDIRIGQPQVIRFNQAFEVLGNFTANGSEIRTTEGALRPLVNYALGKHPKGSISDLPGLCHRAEALAKGDRVKSTHTNQAIKELLEERRKAVGPVSQEGIRRSKIEQKADQIERLLAELVQEGGAEGRREALAIIGRSYQKYKGARLEVVS